jgi:2-polyprenyl-6-methoxyphenol hydroxylase-like FAD-dependent oxidoreductase
MQVIVVGGSVAGLGAALALSRRGHDVTLVERDETPLPSSPDEAWFAWDRRGAPQTRHSHAFLARLRNLLRDEYPEVEAELLHQGVTEMSMTATMPPTIDDPSPQPGDEDLVALACRRTTFEWVLRTVIGRQANVEVRTGVGVTGLVTDPDDARRVTGVTLDDGSTLDADLVVAANGRRSSLPAWFTAAGLPEIPETVDDTGIVYFSRFYRLRPGAEAPPRTGPIGGDLGYLKYGVFVGDADTFSITLSCAVEDAELRKALADPALFDVAASLLTATAPWVEPSRSAPLDTGNRNTVHVMAGLLNRLREFVVDGEPLALGLHAIGDSRLCTNPLYGRGCSTSFWQAHLLAEAVAAEPDDLRAQALLLNARIAAEVEPWYRASVQQDTSARKVAARILAGESPDGAPDDPETFMRSVLREGLLPAIRTDAVVFRAFIRSLNLLDPPERMVTDPDINARVLAVWQDRANRPPEPVLGPPRSDLMAALS